MRSLYAVVAAIIVLGAGVLGPVALAANPSPIPVYGGDMTFPPIHGPSDPEEYSWEVDLGSRLSLSQVDSKTVGVYHPDGSEAMLIRAELAHDATGKEVSTTLTLEPPNVITLTVHHRVEGVTYPVGAGASFELGHEYVTTYSPPEVPELSRAPGATLAGNCVVPKLSGRSLMASKRRLREMGCQIGVVRMRRGATAKAGKVVAQNPRPGTVLASEAKVAVTLGI